ncbi:MAG: SPFH domain-containing protein [Tissierellia bacterium]|nr:SPFH domain-containing protein [Tissierellia bacterium]
MGIIKASVDAVKRTAADQWKEMIQPADLTEGVIATVGIRYRDDEHMTVNTKGTPDLISNGSTIIVPDNTCMLLVDKGKVVDFTTEAGQYIVDNSSAPSLFTGNLGKSLKAVVLDSWERVKYGGTTPNQQRVIYISMKEIKDIKFGTPSPLPYYDANYDVDLEVRAHGSYSIKVMDPLKFYMEVLATDLKTYGVENFNDQFRNEFIQKFSVSLSSLSAKNIRISHLMAHGNDLSDHMARELDGQWLDLRGMEILSVAVVSITYSEKSAEILEIRNKGAVLTNPNIREGYLQGSIARGIEAAGSNEAGAGNAFLGVGMGMNASGGAFGQMSQSNQAQIQQENLINKENQIRKERQEARERKASEGSWTCPECGEDNSGNFCSNCGSKKPEAKTASFCPNCGNKFANPRPKFCPECGNKVD